MDFKFHVAVGCIGLVLSFPVFGVSAARGDNNAQHVRTVMQVLPLPKPRRLRAHAAYRVRSYVKRLVDASKPVLGWPALVIEARKYLGTNPTDRKRLWCATFMNLILAKLGYSGTNSDAAHSFAYYGRRIAEPRVGAIAVLSRGERVGHVGVVSRIDARGNPIIIFGNHNRRVGEGIYPRSRVVAYVMPMRRRALARRGNDTPSRWLAPDRPLESPITELLAAINAERTHARVRVARRSTLRRQAQMPSRMMEQMPD